MTRPRQPHTIHRRVRNTLRTVGRLARPQQGGAWHTPGYTAGIMRRGDRIAYILVGYIPERGDTEPAGLNRAATALRAAGYHVTREPLGLNVTDAPTPPARLTDTRKVRLM